MSENSAFKHWCKNGKKFKSHGAAANMTARGVAVRRKVLNAADNRFRVQIPMAGNYVSTVGGGLRGICAKMHNTISTLNGKVGTN